MGLMCRRQDCISGYVIEKWVVDMKVFCYFRPCEEQPPAVRASWDFSFVRENCPVAFHLFVIPSSSEPS